MDGLVFPFMDISEAQKALWSVPNYPEVVSQCPKEYYRYSEWTSLAEYLFFVGMSQSQHTYFIQLMKSPDPKVQQIQLNYLMSWLVNRRADYQQRFAVSAWCLSLMLTECPNWHTRQRCS